MKIAFWAALKTPKKTSVCFLNIYTMLSKLDKHAEQSISCTEQMLLLISAFNFLFRLLPFRLIFLIFILTHSILMFWNVLYFFQRSFIIKTLFEFDLLVARHNSFFI